MAMSTILTGYADIFKELGLGAAIIQRPNVTNNELSSIFWFIMTFGALLALLCFPIAHATGYLMKESRVIPITQSVSVVFILSSLQVIPANLIKRDLDFKKVGLIEMASMVFSCVVMLIVATLGAGVWTFLIGYYSRSFTSLVLLYSIVRWRPICHFAVSELKPYMQFGIVATVGLSFSYLWQKSDRFFAGRSWPSKTLGYYTFALELAQIPTEKIVSLITQVSYPIFSRFQSEPDIFRKLYLQVFKITALLVFPLFIGGFLLGDRLILVFLGEKWEPMTTCFQFLCLSQIPSALNACNNSVHLAQGRPTRTLVFHLICSATLPILFYFSVQHGLKAIVFPWLFGYTIISLFWMFFTLWRIHISFASFIKSFFHPLFGSSFMTLSVVLCDFLLDFYSLPPLTKLIVLTATGAATYMLYFATCDPSIYPLLKRLRSA